MYYSTITRMHISQFRVVNSLRLEMPYSLFLKELLQYFHIANAQLMLSIEYLGSNSLKIL